MELTVETVFLKPFYRLYVIEHQVFTSFLYRTKSLQM